MENTFKIGDRVYTEAPSCHDLEGAPVGLHGIIVYIGSKQICIEFDEHLNMFHKGHDYDFARKDHHCWWVDERFIKPEEGGYAN